MHLCGTNYGNGLMQENSTKIDVIEHFLRILTKVSSLYIQAFFGHVHVSLFFCVPYVHKLLKMHRHSSAILTHWKSIVREIEYLTFILPTYN